MALVVEGRPGLQLGKPTLGAEGINNRTYFGLVGAPGIGLDPAKFVTCGSRHPKPLNMAQE